ncbi:HAMP domain-containing histidine kinase [Sneathiella marina]|uniref:histidine kinase n=1 Tax=Sneathiella marina TaxID=2950108 RepID=A0ABY4W7N5_9PROT|nr:HAMP domain-containing sensor histidine kinase [Sneathiella marina]USG61765.1 HAMP domain-containing histidine kinase [Sneathiella marina]
MTLLFVMLAEVLIFVPSVAFFRLNYLAKKTEFAHLATLSLLASPDNMVSEELKEELLFRVGARSVVLHGANSRLLILSENMPPGIDAEFNLANSSPRALIEDAFMSLMVGPDRIIRIITPIENEPNSSLEVVIDESPLIDAMYDYAWNIFWLSLIISLLTAILVYLSLHWLMVRPMRRLSENMISFRRAPEDPTTGLIATGRQDEIGVAERELKIMQTRLRTALKQKQHLAALGTAVTKISHDLRNILSTSQIVSDSLAQIDDPKVQKIVPRLMTSIDRAIELCSQTLKYGKAEEREPKRERFLLEPLVNEVKTSVGMSAGTDIVWKNDIPSGLMLNADRDQLYRVLLNLSKNAIQAMGSEGLIEIEARRANSRTILRISDSGPGLPAKAKEHLFEPFSGSARAEGTGLGLSIAHELITAHGGDITLERTDESGTVFRVKVPD